MSDQRTPDWLIETQNKSWEPEIIISGIILTFVFLLPDHLYNFFASLIQDHAVWSVVGRFQYSLCLLLLTGLKIILIIHLVLRGLWAGYVGLSYVFPHGVKTEKLPENARTQHFVRPEEFVIRIERVCSLLFSMVFTSVYFVLGFFLLFIPITLLFFTPLDQEQIKNITLYVMVPLGSFVLPVVSILLSTVWKNSWFSKKLEQIPLGQIIMMYVTNIGRVKTLLIYGGYFALILALAWNNMHAFSFKNRAPVEPLKRPGIVALSGENYENIRNERLRVQRATIDSYRQHEYGMRLFVARYMEDVYTVRMIKENGKLREKAGITADVDELWVQDLFDVRIDDQKIKDLKWVFTQHPRTGQWGFETVIPLEGVAPGDHTLKIEKWLWEVRKDKLKHLDPWAVIPFEVEKGNALQIPSKEVPATQ